MIIDWLLINGNWYSCVTMATFDFTLHKPCSCFTIQQIRQSIAFLKDCSRYRPLSTRNIFLRSISWLSPLHVPAACMWGSSHRPVSSKGQPGQTGHHILDSPALPPTPPLPSEVCHPLLRDPCAHQHTETHPGFHSDDDFYLLSCHEGCPGECKKCLSLACIFIF